MPKPIVRHIPVRPFCQRPDWRTRPWPPRDKYEHCATDAELGP